MELVGKGASDGGSVDVDFSDCAFYASSFGQAMLQDGLIAGESIESMLGLTR